MGGGIWRTKECNPSVQQSFGNYSSTHLSLNHWAQCFPFDLAEACKGYAQKACWKFLENKWGCKHVAFCWLAKLNRLLPLSCLPLPRPLATTSPLVVHAGGLCEPSLASVELSDEPVNAAITEPLQLMCGLVPSLCWGGLRRCASFGKGCAPIFSLVLDLCLWVCMYVTFREGWGFFYVCLAAWVFSPSS